MTHTKTQCPTEPCPVSQDSALYAAWLEEHMDQLRRGDRRPGQILPIDMDVVRARLASDEYDEQNVSDDLTPAECGLEG